MQGRILGGPLFGGHPPPGSLKGRQKRRKREGKEEKRKKRNKGKKKENRTKIEVNQHDERGAFRVGGEVPFL